MGRTRPPGAPEDGPAVRPYQGQTSCKRGFDDGKAGPCGALTLPVLSIIDAFHLFIDFSFLSRRPNYTLYAPRSILSAGGFA
jgi:hypothetical protein